MNENISNLISSILSDSNKYISFSSGDSNIILSAPHGGSIKPITIPRRTYGNRSRDTYTRELINLIINNLKDKPYYIYSNIHRDRIDLNRDITEACQGNKKRESIWRNWNFILHSYTNDVRYYHKKGLYIDIHSHNNSDEFQIGYNLNVRDYLHLMNDDKVPTKNSSMHELKEHDKDKYISEYSILFGEYSIYNNIKSAGYKVLIPSSEKEFLNGGWNIKTNHGNGIGAMQIECPISVLRDDLDNVALVIANSIDLFRSKFIQK